jgi:glutamate dehydrogenase/leucine dehydrogenase
MVTGKPIDLGGSQGRAEATGYGCVVTLMEAAHDAGIDPNGATASIQGFGNAGQHVALELLRRGCRVIAVSDSRAAISNPQGLDILALIRYKAETGSVGGFRDGKAMDQAGVLTTECDFLIPAALEDAITADIAPNIKAKIIAEAANGPTTQDAGQILHRKGIVVIPDVLANAGGVTVSYFEWVQNRQEYYWSRKEVIDRLTDKMTTAYRQIADMAKADKVSLRQAAYATAINRVVQASLERGAQ